LNFFQGDDGYVITFAKSFDKNLIENNKSLPWIPGTYWTVRQQRFVRLVSLSRKGLHHFVAAGAVMLPGSSYDGSGSITVLNMDRYNSIVKNEEF
jgi:hypothetical protein